MKKQGRRYNRDYPGLSDRTGILHEHDYVCDKHKSEKTDNKTEAEGIKLGLDLSGGVSITYRIKDKNPSKKDINDTVAKLEERAESYSTEYAVYPVGDDRITVEIPGVYDANAVLEDLGSPGSLYFIVQKDSDGNENYSYDSSTGEYKLNYDIQNLVDNGSVIMDGNDVKSANAAYNQSSSTSTKEPVVQLTLKKKQQMCLERQPQRQLFQENLSVFTMMIISSVYRK